MTDLPAKNKGDPRFMMVITDRLLKSVTIEAMTTMGAEACAERFVQCHYRYHGFPDFITSDRGSNWWGTSGGAYVSWLGSSKGSQQLSTRRLMEDQNG